MSLSFLVLQFCLACKHCFTTVLESIIDGISFKSRPIHKVLCDP